MRKLFLSLIAFAAFSNVSFAANEIVKENQTNIRLEISKTDLAPTVTLCETSVSRDVRGNIVASGTCCRTISKKLSKEDEVAARVGLKICADAALEVNLSLISNE